MGFRSAFESISKAIIQNECSGRPKCFQNTTTLFPRIAGLTSGQLEFKCSLCSESACVWQSSACFECAYSIFDQGELHIWMQSEAFITQRHNDLTNIHNYACPQPKHCGGKSFHIYWKFYTASRVRNSPDENMNTCFPLSILNELEYVANSNDILEKNPFSISSTTVCSTLKRYLILILIQNIPCLCFELV